jgi:hypothetical protein
MVVMISQHHYNRKTILVLAVIVHMRKYAQMGRRLSQVAWQASPALALAEGSRRTVSCRPQRTRGGPAGQLLVGFSPTGDRQPGRPRDGLQRKAAPQRRRRHAAVREAAQRHRPRPARAVRGALTKRGRPDRLTDGLGPTCPRRRGAVVARRGQGERRQQRASTPRAWGTTVLLPDRQERAPPRLVDA